MSLQKDLEALIDYYKWDESVPLFRLQALLDAQENDSYKTGKPPASFVAFPSQAEGGRCIE